MLYKYRSSQDYFIIVSLNEDTLLNHPNLLLAGWKLEEFEEEPLAFLVETILIGKLRTKL